MASVIPQNDQQVGLALFELYRRGVGGCDGFQVNTDQVLCFASYLPNIALPHLPHPLALSLILGELDHIIPVQRSGASSYSLWLGWSNEHYLWLWLNQVDVTDRQFPLLDRLGATAGAKVFRNDDALRFVWEPK